MTDKREVGRPKKTLNDLPEDWRLKMLEYATDGKSKLQCRVEILGISTELWYDLIEREPEFSQTVKDCQDLSESYWQSLGQDLSKGSKEGSAAVYIFNMKNRFGWKDKVEITGDADRPVHHKIDSEAFKDPEKAHQAWQEMQRDSGD